MSADASATPARIVYVGVPSTDEAMTIGRTLVAERLAGATNIIPGVTSFFWWDGELKEKIEATLLVFTLDTSIPRLITRIRSLHSYVTPGIKIVTVSDGDPEWLAWLHRTLSP